MAKDVFEDALEKPIVVLEDVYKEVRLEFYQSYMLIMIVKEGFFGKRKFYNARQFAYNQLDSFMFKIEKKILGPVIHVRIDFGLELLDWNQVIQYKFSVPSDKQDEYQAFFESVEKVVNGEN